MTPEQLCLEQQEIIEKLVRMNGALLLEVIQHRELSAEEARVLASAEDLGKGD